MQKRRLEPAFQQQSRLGLRPPHQPQRGRQPQAALACERDAFELTAVGRADPGKADPDLVAAEHGIVALRRRVLLVEHLALPAAVR